MVSIDLQHRHHSVRRIGFCLAAGMALLFVAPVTAFATTTAHHRAASVVAHNHGIGLPPGISIAGKVISLGNGSVVVQDQQGFWRTINLEPTTTYSEGPVNIAPAATSADIAVGSEIVATGTVGTDHTSLDASAIKIELASVSGTVTSVSSTAVVVSNHGTTTTLTISSQTVVFTSSGVSSISTVVVGSVVRGFGVLQTNGSLLTLYLGVAPAHQTAVEQVAIFNGNLPNRYCPNHYAGHGFKR